MDDLIELRSCSPENYLSRLQDLSWIHFKEVIDHPLTDRSGFYLVLLEFVSLLSEMVIHQRGPGILGYLNQIELNFSPRVNASYDPHSRRVCLNLGFMLYISELEATYQWLDSLFFTGMDEMPLDEIARLGAPPEVEDELVAIFNIGVKGLLVSGKYGLTHPIGLTILRFVIAHELAHLIDAAESSKLQASWRKAAWADYNDALEYCRFTGWIGQERYEQFQRSSMPEQIMNRWANEFVADGLGFYTLSKAPPPGIIEPGIAYPILQIAVEIFFLSFVAAYQSDIGSVSHPPPTLRLNVIRASQRKLYRVSWAEFLANCWGPGFITNEILTKTMKKIRRENEFAI
jgi:hypothetical protein